MTKPSISVCENCGRPLASVAASCPHCAKELAIPRKGASENGLRPSVISALVSLCLAAVLATLFNRHSPSAYPTFLVLLMLGLPWSLVGLLLGLLIMGNGAPENALAFGALLFVTFGLFRNVRAVLRQFFGHSGRLPE
jgi:hypothetical protein